MAIFAEVTENERIIDSHLRSIHPLLDYDASEKSVYDLDFIEIALSALKSLSLKPAHFCKQLKTILMA